MDRQAMIARGIVTYFRTFKKDVPDPTFSDRVEDGSWLIFWHNPDFNVRILPGDPPRTVIKCLDTYERFAVLPKEDQETTILLLTEPV